MPRRRRLPPDTRPRWQDVDSGTWKTEIYAKAYDEYDYLPVAWRRELMYLDPMQQCIRLSELRYMEIANKCEEIKESIQQQDAVMEAATQRIRATCDRIDRQLTPRTIPMAEQARNELEEVRKPGFFSRLLHAWRG